MRFSVVVPLYNKENCIRMTLESVKKQSFKDYEVIVVDDGSTDRSLEEARKIKSENITIIHQQNQGVSVARNTGILHAQGQYIAFLDADDWWEKGKLKAQTEVMEQTGCAICSTGRELMTPDGRTTGKYIPVKERITYRELLKHNSINCSSVVIRTDVAREFPMEHDDSHEDYITWLKVLRKYGYAVGIDKPYLKYRLSEGGKSRNKLKSAVMTYNVYRYAGYGRIKSCIFFCSYALHGIWKYCHR